MPQMAGNIAEPRLSQTQKYMKHRYVKLCIKKNIYQGLFCHDQVSSGTFLAFFNL